MQAQPGSLSIQDFVLPTMRAGPPPAQTPAQQARRAAESIEAAGGPPGASLSMPSLPLRQDSRARHQRRLLWLPEVRQQSAVCGPGMQLCMEGPHAAAHTASDAPVNALAGLWVVFSQHSVAFDQAGRPFLSFPLREL